MVVPHTEAGATRWEDVQHPSLVIVILSPASTRYDRFTRALTHASQPSRPPTPT